MSILNRKRTVILFILILILLLLSVNNLLYWAMEDKSVRAFGDFDRYQYVEIILFLHTIFAIFLLFLMFYLLGKLISGHKRRLRKSEYVLMKYLVTHSDEKIPDNWADDLLVSVRDETGSLLLYPSGASDNGRILGSNVCECCFRDLDGILVFASLSLDRQKRLFELNFWKEDYSKIKKISPPFETVTTSEKRLC